MKKIFVGNLPYQASDEELREWFAGVAIEVASITIVHDRFSGQPRGFGFVELSNDADAARALATCNGREFQGRSLIVDEAAPREERSVSPPQGKATKSSARSKVRRRS